MMSGTVEREAVGVGAFWLAEQVGLDEPPKAPEQVHDAELPDDGNDVLLDEPLAHCAYGL